MRLSCRYHRNAGEWVTDLQIGNLSQISTELFPALARFSGLFVMPHASEQSRDVDVLQGQNCWPSTGVHTFAYVWISAAVRLTGRDPRRARSSNRAFPPQDRDLRSEPAATELRALRHARLLRALHLRSASTNINFPHRGQRAILQWNGVRQCDRREQTSDQVDSQLSRRPLLRARYARALGVRRHDAAVQAHDINLLFPSGLPPISRGSGQIRSPADFGIARLLYYRQIRPRGTWLPGRATYLGLSLEAGNVWQKRGDMRLGNTEKDAQRVSGNGHVPGSGVSRHWLRRARQPGVLSVPRRTSSRRAGGAAQRANVNAVWRSTRRRWNDGRGLRHQNHRALWALACVHHAPGTTNPSSAADRLSGPPGR